MEILIATLQDSGYRLTAQRMYIIAHLWEPTIITNIDEIYIKLRLKKRISWATVYSTIKLLYDLGWLSLTVGI